MRGAKIKTALRVLLAGFLFTAWIGCGIFCNDDHPDEYRSYLEEKGHDPNEARRLVESAAQDYLSGRWAHEGDPAEPILDAAYCYSALAESAYGHPEDWDRTDAYIQQALTNATTPKYRAFALMEHAGSYARKGQMAEAWRTASQASALGSTAAQREEFKRWAREDVAKGQKIHARGRER